MNKEKEMNEKKETAETGLVKILSSLNEEQTEVVENAVIEFQNSLTYKHTKSPQMKQQLCSHYALFILDRYEHYAYLPQGHYLKGGFDGRPNLKW